MQRVGVIFGGRSVEHRVSVASARTVIRGLEEAGFEVVPFGIAPNGCWLGAEQAGRALAAGDAALTAPEQPIGPTLKEFVSTRLDVVFPIVHGTWGEDGTLQGLFEMLDLAYVGAGVRASALAMDKLACKRLLQASGVPVVAYEAVLRSEMDSGIDALAPRLAGLGLPLFVKPSNGGSSVGVRRVQTLSELGEAVEFALGFDDCALIETAVEGRELECAVLGYRELEASAVGEIVPGNRFYDYADKYIDDQAGLIAPAELDAALERRVRDMAVAAFAAIGGDGMARVDFLLDGDRPMVNEINPLPGFTDISMYPRLWEISDLSLAQLTRRLVEDAVERHAHRQRLDVGIKEWLASL